MEFGGLCMDFTHPISSLKARFVSESWVHISAKYEFGHKHITVEVAVWTAILLPVALFDALVDESIAAACERTVIEAIIGVRCVRIIAVFVPLVNEAIPAHAWLAGVGACVVVIVVSVVATFVPLVDVAIAAIWNRVT